MSAQPLVIVAFLQNLWVKDPDRVKALIEKHGEEYRRHLIKQLLFAGGLTGKRLRATFGDLIYQIDWEEASREIAADAKTICRPDLEHIQAVLDAYQPDIVITFGNVAFNAVAPLWKGKLIFSQHPASRRKYIVGHLHGIARQLREAISEHQKGEKNVQTDQAVA